MWIFRWNKSKTWDNREIIATIKTADTFFTITKEQAEQYYYVPMLVVTSSYTAENLNLSFEWYKILDSDAIYTNQGLSIELNGVKGRVTTLENKKYLDIPSAVTKDVNILHDKNGLYADSFSWDSPNLPSNSNSDVITFQSTPNNYSQIMISKTMADKGQLYIRTMNSGTWNAWKRLVTADDLANKTFANNNLGNVNGAEKNVEKIITLNDNLNNYSNISFYLRKDGHFISFNTCPIYWFVYSSSNANKLYLFNPLLNNAIIYVYMIDKTHIGINSSVALDNTYYIYAIANKV
jgi:hypothetical protein